MTEEQNKEFFTTSFNQKIAINREYKKIHGDISLQGEFDLLEEKAVTPIPKNALFSRFLKNSFAYSLIIDFLESIGEKTEWENALDIGGQQGLISRILHGEGKSGKTTCLEKYDFSHSVDTKTMEWCLKTYKRWKLVRKIGIKNKKIERLNKAYISQCQNYGYFPNKAAKFWNLEFTKKPDISNFLVEDIFQHKKQYDLITALHLIDYFDHEKLFKKIYELLTEGGIFIFIVNSFWWPVNSTKIVGFFPYAAQRLSRDDFVKYVEKYHNDEKEDMIKSYDFFSGGLSKKPTLSNYIEIAQKNGLRLVSCKRFTPRADSHSKTPLTTTALETCSDVDLIEVLDNIHKFRPDVGEEDLKTSYLMGVFTKFSSKEKSLSEKIMNLRKNGSGNYSRKPID